MNILDSIVKQKRKELSFLKKKIRKESLILKCKQPRKIFNFKSSISKTDKINIIGEIKRLSPSAGVLRKAFDPVKIAKVYKKSGISALSVLTDEKFFAGKLEYLKLIKKNINLPILRKDFIIDDYQIYESYVAGADAILLIAQLLSRNKLKDFIKLTHKLGLVALVEVHNRRDLSKALDCGAMIIGINNRNLRTFKVTLQTTYKLIKLIPQTRIIISESGIKSHKDILNLKKAGINAVLIGEAFMKASNLAQEIKTLVGRTT